MISIINLLMKAVGADLFGFFALKMGLNEAALKLFMSILLAYPIAIFYDDHMKDRKKIEKLLYIILTALDILLFNFGTQSYHILILIVVFFVTMKIFGAGIINTAFTFTFTLGYLLAGYYYTESENYDITWTMPACILMLRLVGLSFDLWDGSKTTDKTQARFKDTAVERQPEFLELMSFCLFPAYFLVGPQFHLVKFYDFIEGKNNEHKNHDEATLRCLLLGCLYLIIHIVLDTFFPTEYLLTQDFKESSFLYKHFFIGLWGKGTLYKYISCWLLAEGACNKFRLSYNNKTEKWDLCSNIKLDKFELATRFGHYIEGFNVNTNLWSAQYIYKRLAFLGNKYYSQGITILFLAIWHGLHSGYYMTFLMEFIIMYFEKQTQHLIEKYPFYHKMWNNYLVSFLLFCVLKLYTIIFMGWCMLPFDLKSADRWWPVYKTLYLSGLVFFIVGIVSPHFIAMLSQKIKKNIDQKVQ